MVAVAPDRPAAVERSVDGPSDPDGEAPGPARQRLRILGFDHQVEVISLDGEVQGAELRTVSGAHAFADGLEEARCPQ